MTHPTQAEDQEYLTNYRYSEIFSSIQGEGFHTGKLTAWLRTFMCNLQCNGFGQKHPTKPETHELPYLKLETSKYGVIEDLPVFDKGCDSSYSWAAKFKHLQKQGTVDQIAQRIRALLVSPTNPQGAFHHPKTLQDIHLCFTGGEPLLPISQQCTLGVFESLWDTPGGGPRYITYETNGTQILSELFVNTFDSYGATIDELFFSVSPKLYHVTGETADKAIHPEIVKTYADMSQITFTNGQLKFVLNNDPESWEELDRAVDAFHKYPGLRRWPVYVMPVSATKDDQLKTAEAIADKAIARGFNISARVHCYLWNNPVGK